MTKNKINMILMIILMLGLCGCSALKTVDAGYQQVNVGDNVEITTHSGDVYSFIVGSVSPELIKGDGESILWSDVAELKKKEFSIQHTILLVPLVYFAYGFFIFGGPL